MFRPGHSFLPGHNTGEGKNDQVTRVLSVECGKQNTPWNPSLDYF